MVDLNRTAAVHSVEERNASVLSDYNSTTYDSSGNNSNLLSEYNTTYLLDGVTTTSPTTEGVTTEVTTEKWLATSELTSTTSRVVTTATSRIYHAIAATARATTEATRVTTSSKEVSSMPVIIMSHSKATNDDHHSGSTGNVAPVPPAIITDNDSSGDHIVRTSSGIPVNLIWVPYVVLTCIIIFLIIVSFIRFHRKNGHKYRRRQIQLWKTFNVHNLLSRLENHRDGGGPSSSNPMQTVNNTSGGGNPSSHPSSRSHNMVPPPPNGGMLPPHHNQASTSATTATSKRHHRPLTFTRNENGSMVDLRCGERNSTHMFKSAFSPTADTSIWTLPTAKSKQPYSNLASPTNFSDEDDDDVLLIHQTKL